MFRILVVEDDLETRQLYQHALVKNGYNVRAVANGVEALKVIDEEYFDLMISDVMMPGMSGYELSASLRESNINIPILMVTAKDAFDDMQKGFLSGTDDYMVKPINVNEMMLRVRALLRRAQIINERRLILGGTTLDCDSMSVYSEGENIVLPQKEFMLLFKMASSPGKIFTKQQMMDDIWGYKSESDTHTVEVHVGRLRDRFRDNPDFHIATVRGLGYKLEKSPRRKKGRTDEEMV